MMEHGVSNGADAIFFRCEMPRQLSRGVMSGCISALDDDTQARLTQGTLRTLICGLRTILRGRVRPVV